MSNQTLHYNISLFTSGREPLGLYVIRISSIRVAVAQRRGGGGGGGNRHCSSCTCAAVAAATDAATAGQRCCCCYSNDMTLASL